MSIPFSITATAISVFTAGKYKSIPKGHQNFDRLAIALRQEKQNLDLILELADISTFIARRTMGEVQISDDKVKWRGTEVHGVIVDRILDHMKLGYALDPLVNFLAKVQLNPIEAAKNELFEWLEAGNAPITPDGFFIAFKKVRGNYTDSHSGTFDNSVGKVCQMPREQVDPDRRNECSTGLHFCSFGYLSEFNTATHKKVGNDRVMVVRIDPADVVAIPNDHNRQKGRTWRYEVIGEIEQAKASTIYTNKPVVNPMPAPVDEDQAPTPPAPDAVIFPVGSFVMCSNDGGNGDLTEGGIYEVLDGDEFAITINDDDGGNYDYDTELFRAATDEEIAAYKTAMGLNDIAPLEPEEPPSEVAAVAVAEKQFFSKTAGKTMLESEVKAMLSEHGQRGMSRLTGIPRTTIQLWVEQMKG